MCNAVIISGLLIDHDGAFIVQGLSTKVHCLTVSVLLSNKQPVILGKVQVMREEGAGN